MFNFIWPQAVYSETAKEFAKGAGRRLFGLASLVLVTTILIHFIMGLPVGTLSEIVKASAGAVMNAEIWVVEHNIHLWVLGSASALLLATHLRAMSYAVSLVQACLNAQPVAATERDTLIALLRARKTATYLFVSMILLFGALTLISFLPKLYFDVQINLIMTAPPLLLIMFLLCALDSGFSWLLVPTLPDSIWKEVMAEESTARSKLGHAVYARDSTISTSDALAVLSYILFKDTPEELKTLKHAIG